MTDPIRKRVTVPLRPDQAFDLFTDRIAQWWPVETHSISAGQGEVPRDVTIDPREGGEIIERTHDGGIARWGRVTAWQPGRRIAISWFVGRNEDEATDIDVTFTAVETGTEVHLTHDGFDRLPASARAATRDSYHTGWDLVLLDRYVGFCRRSVPVA